MVLFRGQVHSEFSKQLGDNGALFGGQQGAEIFQQRTLVDGVLGEVRVKSGKLKEHHVQMVAQGFGATVDQVLQTHQYAAHAVVGRFQPKDAVGHLRLLLDNPGEEDLLFSVEVLEEIVLSHRKKALERFVQRVVILLPSDGGLEARTEISDQPREVMVVVLEAMQRVVGRVRHVGTGETVRGQTGACGLTCRECHPIVAASNESASGSLVLRP